MASNSSVYIECSDWLVFGRDFTVRTITMETVLFGFFFFSCYRSGKIQTVKTQEDKKKRFGAGTKQMNEVNTSA